MHINSFMMDDYNLLGALSPVMQLIVFHLNDWLMRIPILMSTLIPITSFDSPRMPEAMRNQVGSCGTHYITSPKYGEGFSG